MADLYRSADLYVHAAPEESFCLAAVEALACGTPVVAAAAGGITEVVEHERTGLLTPPGEPEDLARAVMALLQDGPRRSAMARAAAECVLPRFDGDRTTEELHAFCEALHERHLAASGGRRVLR